MPDIVDRFRSSTSGWLRGTSAGLGTVLLGLAGLVGAVLAGGGILPFPAWAPLLLTLAAGLIVTAQWIANWGATYELTDDRLILHRGIFMKSLDEVELYRVKDVRLDYTLLGQWAGIGNISLTSSDATTADAPLTLPNIAHAHARREEMRRRVDAARQRRLVREVDMAHDHL